MSYLLLSIDFTLFFPNFPAENKTLCVFLQWTTKSLFTHELHKIPTLKAVDSNTTVVVHAHTRDCLCRWNTLNTMWVIHTAKLPCFPPYGRAKVKKRHRGHKRMSKVGREMEKSVVGKEREWVETHRDGGSGAYWSHESHMGTTRLTES